MTAKQKRRDRRRETADQRVKQKILKSPVSRLQFLVYLCIILAGILAYANSFSGVFLFDDLHEIVDNERIRTLAWPFPFLENTRRPILYLSFAINYALGGGAAGGYHFFNLSVHILSALLLFGIIRRTCLVQSWDDTLKKDSLPFALAAVLLWLLHPLQTQSVTYIIQRAESLMGMFYLAALYGAIRYFENQSRRWIIFSVGSCLLGGLTKEVIVTAPLVIFLYDRTFFSKSFSEIWLRHKKIYAGLAVSWVVLLALFLTIHSETKPTAGFAYQGISPQVYALNQPSVILHYLRLAFWPSPLVLDYNWATAQSLAQVFPSMIVIVLLIGLSGTAFFYPPYRWLAFLGSSFFIILLPSSSFIPLRDLAFEHRMYLPLAAVIILGLLGFRYFFSKRALSPFVAGIVVISSGFLTFQRNQDYQSEIRMWTDVLKKRPQNARASFNLGTALQEEGSREEAIVYYRKTLSLDPDYTAAHVNLGAALDEKGNSAEAKAHFLEAIRLEPDAANAHSKLGLILVREGKLEQAETHFVSAIRWDPNAALNYNNLGAVLLQQGKYQDAIPQFQKALEHGFPEQRIYQSLALCLARMGKREEAEEYLQKANLR